MTTSNGADRMSRRAFSLSASAIAASAATPSALAQATPPTDIDVDTLQDDLYADRDWTDDRGGEINLSGFTFRDMDTSGDYSLGDLPHFGASIQMVRPDGRTFVQRSNRNGFSNFSASLSNPDAAINMAGEYVFSSIPPKGWHVTTGNQTQAVQVSEQIGSIGGWVMDHLPHPYGIAPDLEIRGNATQMLEAFGDTELLATDPSGTAVMVDVTEDGTFALPVTAGEWTIGGAAATFPPRTIEVGFHSVAISGVAESTPAESRAGSTVAGFDDLVSGSTLRKVPNGYQGLRWSGLNAISNLFSSGGEGYTNCTQSGEYLAYSSSGHPVIITHETGFDFVGGYFGVAWPAAEGETIRMKAYRDDDVVAEDAFRGSAYGSVYFAADYRGITRLEITTDHYWQFVVDDMEFIVP